MNASRLPGTTLRNRVLYASTGCESLDALLSNAGAPNTSLLVVDEVNGARKAFPAVARCFLAEGVAESQTTICAAALCSEAIALIENLPKRIETSGDLSHLNHSEQEDSDFRIAWRYSSVPKMESSVRSTSKTVGMKFDLSKRADWNVEALKRDEKLVVLAGQWTNGFATFDELWRRLSAWLRRDEFTDKAPPAQRRFLRVVISDLSSLLWTDPQNFSSFLIHLKAFCRKANCIVLISIDSSLISRSTVNTVLRLADAFIRFEFMDEDAQKAMGLHQKFDGRLFILKLPTVFAAAPPRPDCLDLIFSVKRTHLDVKIFHLPPAITRDDASSTKTKKTGGLCQAQEEF